VDAGAFMSSWGPVRYHFGQVSAEAVRLAKAAMIEAFRAFEGSNGVVLRAQAWLVTAAARA
jgi:hypothetical protein